MNDLTEKQRALVQQAFKDFDATPKQPLADLGHNFFNLSELTDNISVRAFPS